MLSFCFFKFSSIFQIKTIYIVDIAHNIYNFVYAATGYPSDVRPAGYPANETRYPAGYRIIKRPDIRNPINYIMATSVY